MKKGPELYSGKAKTIYNTDQADKVIVEYRNDLTALDGQKHGEFAGKGAINNQICSEIYRRLNKEGIKTHFIEELSPTEMLVKKVEIIPLEVIIRNVAAGSFSKNYGVDEGTELKTTILEFSYKDDSLGDPLINDYHILALDIASEEDLEAIKKATFTINQLLIDIFKKAGLRLIDFKLEFGKDENGEIILADEVSPDTCRLWDIKTNEKFDKDLFRRDLGGYEDAYKEVLARIKD